jgi:hypothetical protein
MKMLAEPGSAQKSSSIGKNDSARNPAGTFPAIVGWNHVTS